MELPRTVAAISDNSVTIYSRLPTPDSVRRFTWNIL
jgi:hypothetical protein